MGQEHLYSDFQLSVGSNQTINLILLWLQCGLRLAAKSNGQVIELTLQNQFNYLVLHSVKSRSINDNKDYIRTVH